MQEKGNLYSTSDLGIAAYIKLKGVRLVECKRLDNGRFYFSFEEPERCESLAIEFLESDFCRYDNITRNLKKLLFR